MHTYTRISAVGDAPGARRPARPLAAPELMIAGVAHDLRNQLQIISAAIHLVERSVGGGERSEVLDFTKGATDAVNRAVALSQRLLARASRDRAPIGPVQVGQVLEAMADVMRVVAGPGISVDLRVGVDTPTVDCDIGELEDAVLNLVVNARDAMPDGGRITLSSYLEDVWDRRRPGQEARRFAVLAVSDNGVGMSAEAVARAFDPFFTTKPKSKGTGLGLTQVREFVRRNGGAATISSAPGAGTTVFLHLPPSSGRVAQDPQEKAS